MIELNRKTIIIFGIILVLILVGLIFLFPKKKKDDAKGNLAPTATIAGQTTAPIPSATITPPPTPIATAPFDIKKIETEANQRDSERISNITAMSAVLMSYIGETGDPKNYPPYPIASTWVNLSDKNNKVVKNLKEIAASSKTLTPKVFDKIDPLAPDFYYAYRSRDGKTCEVSIRLEAVSNIYRGMCSKLITDKCVYIYKVERPQFQIPVGAGGGES